MLLVDTYYIYTTDPLESVTLVYSHAHVLVSLGNCRSDPGNFFSVLWFVIVSVMKIGSTALPLLTVEMCGEGVKMVDYTILTISRRPCWNCQSQAKAKESDESVFCCSDWIEDWLRHDVLFICSHSHYDLWMLHYLSIGSSLSVLTLASIWRLDQRPYFRHKQRFSTVLCDST